jgi:hypothetical protein
MSTVWQPFQLGRKVSDLSTLEGLLIPDPDALQGWIAYVVNVPAPISGPSYYALSLTSGAPLDPTEVRPTLIGGASRWLRVNILGGGIGGNPTIILPDDVPVPGTSPNAARSDHRHGILVDLANNLAAGALPGEGGAASFARSDHQHGVPVASPPALSAGQASAQGVSPFLVRSDHQHGVPVAAPATLGIVNAEGVSTSLVRADHVHAHGNQPGGTLHDLATVATAGFMSAADKAILDGLTSLYKALLVFGAQSVANTTTTRYLPFGYITGTAPTNRPAFHMPATGALRNLYVRHNAPGGGPGGIINYTIRINGIATALTVAALSTGMGGSNLVTSIPVVAGDLIDLQVTKPVNIGGSPADAIASLEFVA